MDKAQLQKVFSASYNHQNWLEVLKTVFGAKQLLMQPRPISLVTNDITEGAFELGNITTSDDRIIGLYKIEVKSNVWLERNKVGLRKLLRDVYNYDVDGALIVFVQDKKWRLSFVSEVKVLNEEGEVVKEVTEPKRYTYLLGEGEKIQTPSIFLSKLAGKVYSLEDIRKSFSVDVLNEEFYKIIQQKFYELVGGKIGSTKKQQDFGNGQLALPSVSNDARQVHQEFAVRLIGRTVFCWFLKMKKTDDGEALISEELLSSKAVKINKNYYHFILERLFFQTLNTPMNERIADLPKGCEKVPFLNGGLFEPGQDDYYRYNNITGLSEHINTLVISDEWFLSFFEELEKYNFTIDENSVTDIEVSVDPEMLGRIFENLLAEIDPDSGETARKATGSFYTPREIVDYMAVESLVQYVHNKTSIDQDRLREVFRMSEKDELDFIESERIEILKALDTVKILDPACGSGAFPMGVLQKIVVALQKLDKSANWWIQQRINENKNVTARKAVREKLEGNSQYARKIGIIQNSLYGVDIQPIAAEISKLRCFLTLVVDEKIDDSKVNRGIDPLPNLEFKFVTANTLLKLPEQQSRGLFDHFEELEELEELRIDYLQSSGKEKQKIKEQFPAVQRKIFKEQLNLFIDTESRAYKLSAWDPFGHSKADWFDPKWMYGVKDFDIVIGNPPYRIMTKNNTENELLKNYVKEFTTIKNSSSKNLYIPFIERGAKLLSSQGVLSLIVPEGLFKTRSYSDCVDFLRKNGSVSSVTTFESMVFANATTGNLIFIFSPTSGINQMNYHFNRSFHLSIKEKSDEALLEKIDSIVSSPLHEICHLFKGMVVSDRNTVVGESKDYGTDIFLLGKSMSKWLINKEYCTDYLKLNIVGGTKLKSKHDVFPKIIIRRTGDSLCCALLTKKALTESTLYSCWPKTDEYNIKYLMALLNSSFLTYYIQQKMITNSQAFPQILMTDLAELPISACDKNFQTVFHRIYDHIFYCLTIDNTNQINEHVPNSHLAKLFEEVNNAMVMELYFQKDFKNAGIEFIKFVDRDFKSIEELKSDKEKREIIHEVYQKLREKDNEIRNNLKLMDIKLAEIIMPIKAVK